MFIVADLVSLIPQLYVSCFRRLHAIKESFLASRTLLIGFIAYVIMWAPAGVIIMIDFAGKLAGEISLHFNKHQIGRRIMIVSIQFDDHLFYRNVSHNVLYQNCCKIAPPNIKPKRAEEKKISK